MNRQRYIARDFENEGSPRSQELAAALATRCDPEFLEVLTRHIAALDEFGGELYLAPSRAKFDAEGKKVEPNEAGSWESTGYIFHYGDRTRLKRIEDEPDAEPVAEPIEAEHETSDNGVAVGA